MKRKKKQAFDPTLTEELRQHYARIRAAYVVGFRTHCYRRGGSDPEDYGTRWMRWDGGVYVDGTSHKCAWVKIAQVAATHGMDPVELVRAGFEVWTAQRPPTPYQVIGPQALAHVPVMCRGRMKSLQLDVDNSRSSLAQEIYRLKLMRPDLPEDRRAFIAIDESSVCTLVRYCAAWSAGLPRLMWELRHAAALKYLSYPREYEKILGQFLPEDLKEYARDCVLQTIKQDGYES